MILKAILTCLLIAATVNLATAILSDLTCTENGVLLPSAINCRNNFTDKACGKPVMVAASSDERSKFCLRQSLVGKLFCRRSCGYCCLEVQSSTTTTTTLAPTTTATQTTEQITSTSAPTSTATSVAPSTTFASTAELPTTTTTMIPSTTSTAVPTTTTTVMPTTQHVPAPTARTGDPYACSDAPVFDCSTAKQMCPLNDSSRFFMVTHCPKTCGFCNEIGAGEYWRFNSKTTTTTPAPVDPRFACSDTIKLDCRKIRPGSDFCNSKETKSMAISYCPKACGYCLEFGAGGPWKFTEPTVPSNPQVVQPPAPAPVAPPSPPAYIPPATDVCRDKINCYQQKPYCNEAKYINWMNGNCALTCQRCPGTSWRVPVYVPVSQPVAPPPRPVCVDKVNHAGYSECPASAYLCNNPAYFSFMTEECPVTCNRCH